MRTNSKTKNKREVRKGDIIIYEFGFGLVEAKVIKEYGNGFIKVRHNDFPFILKIFGYKHIIYVDSVVTVKEKGRK